METHPPASALRWPAWVWNGVGRGRKNCGQHWSWASADYGSQRNAAFFAGSRPGSCGDQRDAPRSWVLKLPSSRIPTLARAEQAVDEFGARLRARRGVGLLLLCRFTPAMEWNELPATKRRAYRPEPRPASSGPSGHAHSSIAWEERRRTGEPRLPRLLSGYPGHFGSCQACGNESRRRVCRFSMVSRNVARKPRPKAASIQGLWWITWPHRV